MWYTILVKQNNAPVLSGKQKSPSLCLTMGGHYRSFWPKEWNCYCRYTLTELIQWSASRHTHTKSFTLPTIITNLRYSIIPHLPLTWAQNVLSLEGIPLSYSNNIQPTHNTTILLYKTITFLLKLQFYENKSRFVISVLAVTISIFIIHKMSPPPHIRVMSVFQ